MPYPEVALLDWRATFAFLGHDACFSLTLANDFQKMKLGPQQELDFRIFASFPEFFSENRLSPEKIPKISRKLPS